jgi:putative Mg2+ transporter-C (MgtC) family protein
MVARAALLTVFVLSGGNTRLRPPVNAIDRIPIDAQSSEANYDVRSRPTPNPPPRRGNCADSDVIYPAMP